MFKKVSDLLGHKDFKRSQNFHRKVSNELFDFLDLIRKWETIVGPKLCKVTVPLKNQGKTLTILTNHSAYSQQLSMLEETLKTKILKTFPQLQGKVQHLKFQVSTTHFDEQRRDLLKRANIGKEEVVEKKARTTLHPKSPQYKALREEAILDLGDTSGLDEEFKERMISIYIQNKLKDL